MDLYLIIYFLAGVVQDILFTTNIRFVAKERIWPAVTTSFAVTMVSMLALYTILAKLDQERSLPAIIAYTLGITTGTFIAMKFHLKPKE